MSETEASQPHLKSERAQRHDSQRNPSTYARDDAAGGVSPTHRGSDCSAFATA